MKNTKKVFYLFLFFIGLISLASMQGLNVKADDSVQNLVDTEGVDDTHVLFPSLQIYEVPFDAPDTPMSEAKKLPYTVQPICILVADNDDNGDPIISTEKYRTGPEYINDALNTSTDDLKYASVKTTGHIDYYPATKEIQDENGNKVSGYYVHLISFKPKTIHYIDVATGKEVGSEDNNQSISIKDGEISADGLTLPKGYIYAETKYTVGESTDDLKMNVSAIKPITYTVKRLVNGKEISEKPLSGELKYGEGFSDKDKSAIENYKWKNYPSDNQPTFEDTDKTVTVDGQPGSASLADFLGLYPDEWDAVNTSDVDGLNFTITMNYDYQGSIKNKVQIKNNLGKNISSIEDYSGKIGDQISNVPVPKVSGYKADKDTVTATVQPDGTITSDDTVTYTKTSDNSGGNSGNSGNNNNSYNDDPVISNIGSKIKIATNTQADLYNDYANKLGETVANGKTYEVTKKMTKDGQTYYQIADGKWLKANDAYQYENISDDLRVYNGSYKKLYHSNDKLVRNRGLAAESDWKIDRVAEFNGEKYYRVATDEWVKAADGNLYNTDPTVINVDQGTRFYDEKGNVLGEFGNAIALKADRISDVEGQKMYRVATNEYVLVSDVD